MVRILSYLVKRDGMTDDEFVDYYENHHVPLIASVAPTPIVYKRRYLQRGESTNVGDADLGFDVVTEMVFADRESHQSWIAAVRTGIDGERVAADEARFLDRAATRSCRVRDYVTTE